MHRIMIAHITTVDGSLRYLLYNQLRSIQRAGYEVVTISAPGRDVPALEAAGLRHIAVPMTRSIAPVADARALAQLYRVMRRERPTIVHTHTPKAGLLGQLAARLAGVPIVVNTVHGFYFHEHMPATRRQFYIALERIAARCSDVMLSQNEEDVHTAVVERICPADKIKLLGNGIDLCRFDPARFSRAEVQHKRQELGLPSEAPVVGFVGRLAARRKGFRDFLAAARLVAQRLPDVIFLIVGDADVGKPDAVSPAAAHGYGIAARCFFVGWRPNDELPLLYKLMDVLVLPSLFEGIPRNLMEASAMGVPAVATNVRGNREAIVPGHNGLLVPLGDVDALADAVVRILRDTAMAASLASEGQQIAQTRFDERSVFRMVQEEYARLLAAKGMALPAPQVVD